MAAISTFTGTVSEKKYLTEDILFLSLQVPLTFSFQAGQFVSLLIENGGKTKLKSYSILNPPTERGKIDFCVKLVQDGFASTILKNAKKGDSFTMKGPFGHFLFSNDKNKEHWFIGAGAGITPLYSIIMENVPLHPTRKFVLLFGEKTVKDLLFEQEFCKLERKYKNFEYFPTLSRQQWKGRMGRVQKHIGNNLKDKTFYICGLQELVLETKEYLLNHGADPLAIHFERYT